MATLTLWKENDQLLTLPGVTDKKTGQPITGAAVTVSLYKVDGDELVAAMDHVAMTDVDGVPGSYECEVPHTFNPDEGDYYVLYEGTKDAIQFKVKQLAAVAVRTVK